MMDFILIPLVFAVITFGLYAIFELIIRRKERLSIIEKVDNKFEPADALNFRGVIGYKSSNGLSFGILRISGFLLGIGIGLISGIYFMKYVLEVNIFTYSDNIPWWTRNIIETILGASTMIGGGLGLLIVFLIEVRYNAKKEKYNKNVK